MKRWWGFGVVLISASANAAHCPYPQVLIRHLGDCVSPKSKLALAYVSPRADPWRWRFRHSIPDQHRFKPKDPPLPEPKPAPEPVDEQPVEQPVTIPIPDLQAGIPAFWRLCKEQPTWCNFEGTRPNDR